MYFKLVHVTLERTGIVEVRYSYILYIHELF